MVAKCTKSDANGCLTEAEVQLKQAVIDQSADGAISPAAVSRQVATAFDALSCETVKRILDYMQNDRGDQMVFVHETESAAEGCSTPRRRAAAARCDETFLAAERCVWHCLPDFDKDPYYVGLKTLQRELGDARENYGQESVPAQVAENAINEFVMREVDAFQAQ
jgi:hypothetical protein